jgi:hypothetical protein
MGASITGLVTVTVAFITYLLARRQEEYKVLLARQSEQHAKTIAKLFDILEELQAEFRSWVELYEEPIEEDEDLRKELEGSISIKIKELSSYNRQQALWSNQSAYDRIETVSKKMRGQWLRVLRTVSAASKTGSFRASRNEDLQTVRNWLDIDLKNALESSIYPEFRAILGTDSLQNKNSRFLSEGRSEQGTRYPAFAVGVLVGIGSGGVLTNLVGPEVGWALAISAGAVGISLLVSYRIKPKKK